MHYYLIKICNICVMFKPFEVPMLNKRKVAFKCLLVSRLLFHTLKDVM